MGNQRFLMISPLCRIWWATYIVDNLDMMRQVFCSAPPNWKSWWYSLDHHLLGNWDVLKVNVSNITIIWTTMFEWYVIRCGQKIDTSKTWVYKRLDYVLKYAIHSRFNNQHDRGVGDLYDHFMSTRICTLIMNKVLIRTLKMMRQSMGTIRIC